MTDAVWYALHTGKCSSCGMDKSLDSMVADSMKRDSYHCVDCETDRHTHFMGQRVFIPIPAPLLENQNRLSKIMGWFFG